MDWSAKVREHFDNAANVYGQNNVWVTMLYGSQNYNMATEASDVDVKTMLFPTVRDTVLGKKTDSTDIALPDGSLNGVKDYRDTFDLYLRGNVRYLETIYSEFSVCNPRYEKFFKTLQANRELVANSQPRRLMHSVMGMAKQKYKAMDHPFPSKLEVLAKYKYDPKQFHHLMRLYYFMYDYKRNMSYEKCLRPEGNLREILLGLKTNPLPVDVAWKVAKNIMQKMEEMLQVIDNGALPEDNGLAEAREFMDDLAIDLFKFRYKIEMEEM